MKLYAFNLGMPLLPPTKNILLTMKLTFFILIIALTQVTAKSYSQKVTITNSSISVKSALNSIKNQTGYTFLIKDINLSNNKVNLNLKEADLEDALKIILKGLSVDYQIDTDVKIIILKFNKPSISDIAANILNNIISNIDVKGKVVDSLSHPIVGAVIKIKGTNKSTTTDDNGRFILKNVNDDAIIVISYLGYEKKEIKASESLGTIQLRLLDTNLDEVQINAGYYSVSDRERTGSISRITDKEIGTQPVNNVLAAMQANIPGVQITQNTGTAGGGFTVQVRGRNSISQGNNPFYVIDGVPFTANTISPFIVGQLITPNPSPLASINPNDIESVEVLKDADATAIYGSRGANGVILITTKKGRKGKAVGTLSINQGASRVGKKLDLMNTEQYLAMRNEAYFTNDKLTTTSPLYATQYDINGTWDQNKYTDWQDKLIGGTALTTNIQSSLSGGSENIQYQLGGSFYKEGTVFPGEQSFLRASGNVNLQYKSSNKKFHASFSGNYSQSKSNIFTSDITSLIYLAPNHPSLSNADGSLNWENNTISINPLADIKNPLEVNTNNLITNGLFSYSILPDLKISASFGLTNTSIKNYYARLSSTQIPGSTLQRNASYGNNVINSWITEPQINWTKELGRGKVNVLVGTTFQETITDGENLNGTGYTSDELLRNIGSASLLTVASRQYLQYRYTAFFGRLNYVFDEKYILNLTGRRDGSTRFGSDKQFANFGAIGAAWIISNEDFIKKIPYISFAKLRGSYGITGNDQISDYAYLPLWGSNVGTSATYQGLTTIKPERLSNSEYAWEKNIKTEVALDLGFLENRINFSIGFYSTKSSNQLIQRQLPPTVGFVAITDNLPAKVRNNGFEFLLEAKNLTNGNIKWSSSVNLTIPKNKLISYPGLKTGADVLNYEVGYPLAIKKLLNTYLDPNTGLFAAEDRDANGIDNSDYTVIKFIGRKFYGGLQNNITYSGFELDFLFQFVKQLGLTSWPGTSPGRFVARSNQSIEVLDRWQNQGDNKPFQKFSTNTTANTSYTLARNGNSGVEDASFIRLKNVSLAYNLPTQLIQKINITSAKFFVQGQNIFTITPYKGLDPETQNINFLPPLRVLAVGLQITL